ncbi:MAG: replicative DNA helicase [Oscillospiraceae bacterium]|nr:replicative DNA helicase [Oscillospiraceae bacterium]
MPTGLYSGSADINLPYSLEAEQAVLGAILMEPSCINQALIYVKSDYFYLPQHKAIFSIMQNIDAAGGKIDPLIVLEGLKKENIYDDAGGKNYLFQLAQVVPSTENIESYAKIVREKYYIRTLINTSREIVDEATNNDESADALLDSAEQKIYNIRQGRATGGPSLIGDIIVGDVYDTLKKLSSEDADQYKGFTTGFSDLDRVMTGLNKSDLIIVGARPAMGKTSFALNIARNAAVMAGKKVVFFSLEMTKEQLAQRVLAMESRIEGFKMRTGEIHDEEWKRIAAATAVLTQCRLYIDDTSMITVPEMKARIRRLKDVDLVIIDYLQLMKSSTKTDNRVREVSEITRSLKLMAKDLGVPVITLAQLSRSTEARGKSHRPQLADLRESGSIEQDADIVLMLYRDEYYDSDKDKDEPDDSDGSNSGVNIAEVIVAKNRHGMTGSVELTWNPDYTMFGNLEKFR